MCFTVRCVEGLGAAAFATASFAIMAHTFPDNVATMFVSKIRSPQPGYIRWCPALLPLGCMTDEGTSEPGYMSDLNLIRNITIGPQSSGDLKYRCIAFRHIH